MLKNLYPFNSCFLFLLLFNYLNYSNYLVWLKSNIDIIQIIIMHLIFYYWTQRVWILISSQEILDALNSDFKKFGLQLQPEAHWDQHIFQFKFLSNSFLKLYQPSLAVPGTLAYHLPATQNHLQHCLIKNGQRSLEIGQTLGYWTLQSTFVK